MRASSEAEKIITKHAGQGCIVIDKLLITMLLQQRLTRLGGVRTDPPNVVSEMAQQSICALIVVIQ